MSKIGRKPIALDGVKVEIKGQDVHFSGKNDSGVYALPAVLTADLTDTVLTLKLNTAIKAPRDVNRLWGMHRALLSNKIIGAAKGFEKQLKINGLGYKAALSGNKVVLTLGFSHKINFELPQGVKLAIDKTGQLLTFTSADKALVGHVCSLIRSYRPPEPYKGTGIKLVNEVIARKAGKTKSS